MKGPKSKALLGPQAGMVASLPGLACSAGPLALSLPKHRLGHSLAHRPLHVRPSYARSLIPSPSKTVKQTIPPDGMARAGAFTLSAEHAWSFLWGSLALREKENVNKSEPTQSPPKKAKALLLASFLVVFEFCLEIIHFDLGVEGGAILKLETHTVRVTHIQPGRPDRKFKLSKKKNAVHNQFAR